MLTLAVWLNYCYVIGREVSNPVTDNPVSLDISVLTRTDKQCIVSWQSPTQQISSPKHSDPDRNKTIPSQWTQDIAYVGLHYLALQEPHCPLQESYVCLSNPPLLSFNLINHSFIFFFVPWLNV